MSLLNSLKKQLIHFKNQIHEKDEEIENLKATTKCSKFAELEHGSGELLLADAVISLLVIVRSVLPTPLTV